MIADLVNSEYSIVVAALQYYVGLLDASGSRLALIIGRHSSYGEWTKARPDLNAVFRRGATTAALWLFQRLHVRVNVAPWTLARVTDPRFGCRCKAEHV